MAPPFSCRLTAPPTSAPADARQERGEVAGVERRIVAGALPSVNGWNWHAGGLLGVCCAIAPPRCTAVVVVLLRRDPMVARGILGGREQLGYYSTDTGNHLSFLVLVYVVAIVLPFFLRSPRGAATRVVKSLRDTSDPSRL